MRYKYGHQLVKGDQIKLEWFDSSAPYFEIAHIGQGVYSGIVMVLTDHDRCGQDGFEMTLDPEHRYEVREGGWTI